MSAIVFKAPVIGYPRYEIHYCSAWPAQGRIWSLISDKYLSSSPSPGGYAQCTLYAPGGRKRPCEIHRLLIEHFKPEVWDPELVVNHKDYNRSNNNLSNLEMISAYRNRSDHDKSSTTSQYHGVYWDKRAKKWRAKIDGAHLGRFKSEEMAAKAVDDWITRNGLDSKLNLLGETLKDGAEASRICPETARSDPSTT
jgi:hypothetical protein